jgi:hypothetical protein
MAGKAELWEKIAGAALGLVGATAAVGLGFALSQAWQADTPPERVEVALPPIRQSLIPQPSPKPVALPARPSPQPAPAPTAAASVPAPKTVVVAAATPTPAPTVSPPVSGKPAIAIVIDDLGADISGTRRAMALPKEVTLSFLPYPEKTPELSHDGFCAGHEIILHMPMEPKGNLDPGPNALHLDLPKEEVQRRVLWAFSRVPEADGMNNHEGSWFTSDHKALIPVMQVLAQKHLFFLDSRTTAQSKGVKLARAAGVPVAGRDVFIDDTINSGAIARQLGQIESIARNRGLVIAIGHPHHQTLAALEAWIPAIEKQGYVVIPLSEAIRRRNAPGDSASLSTPAQ